MSREHYDNRPFDAAYNIDDDDDDDDPVAIQEGHNAPGYAQTGGGYDLDDDTAANRLRQQDIRNKRPNDQSKVGNSNRNASEMGTRNANSMLASDDDDEDEEDSDLGGGGTFNINKNANRSGNKARGQGSNGGYGSNVKPFAGDDDDDDNNNSRNSGADGRSNNAYGGLSHQGHDNEMEDNEDEDVDEDDDLEARAALGLTQQYDPRQFAHLPVSAEIRQLFSLITMHKPPEMKIEPRFRPFIPDYVPAIGEMDPFLKVPRPDGKDDGLGTKEVDEPSLVQSDPTVLSLRLRRGARKAGLEPMQIRGIEDAEKHPQKITNWINSVDALHKNNPPPTVTYSKPMPSLDSLVKVWDAEFEAALAAYDPQPAQGQSTETGAGGNIDQGQGKKKLILDPTLDVDTATMAKLACTLCDIPVYEGKTIESLHLLFSLYGELTSTGNFNNKQH